MGAEAAATRLTRTFQAFFTGLPELGSNAAVNEPLDALWWGVGALTAVGSDLFPVTSEGRLSAMLLIRAITLFTTMVGGLLYLHLKSRRPRGGMVGVEPSSARPG